MGRSIGKLFRGIMNMFRAILGMAADTVADDVRDATFEIEDAKENVIQLRESIVELTSESINMEDELKEVITQLKHWSRILKNAQATENQTDIPTIVEKLESLDARKEVLSDSCEQNEEILAELKSQLSNFENQIADASTHLASLKAQKKSNEIASKAQAASSRYGNKMEFQSIANIREKVAKEQNKSKARRSIGSETKSIEDKYSSDKLDILAKYGNDVTEEDEVVNMTTKIPEQ